MTLKTILLLVAMVLFFLAAVEWPAKSTQFGWLGLAVLTISMLVK